MTQLSTKLASVLLVLLLWAHFGFAHVPRKDPLPLLCLKALPPGKGVSINESVILEAEAISTLTLRLCNITMATSNKNNRILINFLTFDIGKTCDDGSIEIFDYFTGDSITGHLCGNTLNKKVFRSHTHAAYLVATPSISTTGYSQHLEIILTSFNSGTQGKCGAREFQCDNKLCIAGDLVCNGYNECSDNSDEHGCGKPTGDPPVTPSGDTPVSVGVIISAVIGSCVLIALIVLGVFGFLRYRRRRHYEAALIQ